MEETVRLQSVLDTSICDGPGIRLVVFFQGCTRGCEGCHNPETWDSQNGEVWGISELIWYIEKHAKTKRVTLSGGEPLEQKAAVKAIIGRLRELGYDIALYTGYEPEEIPQDIFCQLNYVKTGRFIKERRTTTIPYIGSDNQRFMEVNKRGADL